MKCKKCPYVDITETADPLSFDHKWKKIYRCNGVKVPFIVNPDDDCHNNYTFKADGAIRSGLLSSKSESIIREIKSEEYRDCFIIDRTILEKIKDRFLELEHQTEDLTNDHAIDSNDFYKDAYLEATEKLNQIEALLKADK